VELFIRFALQRAFNDIEQAVSPPILDQIIRQLDALGLELAATDIKVLEGAVALGVSVRAPALGLVGSVDALTDFGRGWSDLALTVHPRAAHLLFVLMEGQIRAQALARVGLELDALRFTFHHPERGEVDGGHVRVSGQASFGGATLGSFSLLAKPLLGPTTVGLRVYRFDFGDLPLPLYIGGLIAAGILTPMGLAGLWAELSRVITPSISTELDDAVRGAASLPRVVRLTLPGATRIPLNFRTESLWVNADGVHARIGVRHDWRVGARITGLTSVGPTDPFQQRYRLTGTTSLFHLDDPRVRIRWWLRRSDTRDHGIRRSTRNQRRIDRLRC
jgi:hypothetical protein